MKTFCFIMVILLHILKTYADNFYEVLGVPRSASSQEIKRAYKRLARVWHPDKSGHENANEKFMKINEAYEVLSDQKKRHEYDTFGHVTDDHQQQHHGQHQNFFRGGGFHENIFDFFNNGPGGGGASYTNFQHINYRSFKLTLVPRSRSQPALIFGYSDFCMPCRRIVPMWQQVEEKIRPLGVDVVVVNLGIDGAMRDELRVFHTPTIMALVDEKVTYYRGSASISGVLDFLRNAFPVGLVQPLSRMSDVNDFLSGWTSHGKVRAILAKPLDHPSIRFVLAAFKYRAHIVSGFVNTESSASSTFRQKFHTAVNQETLFIFKESEAEPVEELSGDRLDVGRLDVVLNNNRFLTVPRLSSERVWDELCPSELHYNAKSVCFILLVAKGGEHQSLELAKFREAASSLLQSEKVSFFYVHMTTQSSFLRTMSRNPEEEITSGRVVAVWRQTSREVHYHWMQTDWSYSTLEDFIHAQQSVSGRSQWQPSAPVILPLLVDEFLDPLVIRIVRRAWRISMEFWDWSYPYLSDPTVLMAMAFFGWILLVLFWSLRNMVADDREQSRRRQQQKTAAGPAFKNGGPPSSASLTELSPSTYTRLVRRSPQGVITIILCVSEKNTDKLKVDFIRSLARFGSNRNLQVAYINVSHWPEWFGHMLHPVTLVPPQQLSLQAHNCSGTVFAVNSFRRYLSIYHPKIPSSMRGRRQRRNQPAEEFLGFAEPVTSSDEEEDTSDTSDSEIDPLTHPDGKLFEADLLAGLPNWLDRLFEGSLPRCHVVDWPKVMHASGLLSSAPIVVPDQTRSGTLSDRIFPAKHKVN